MHILIWLLIIATLPGIIYLTLVTALGAIALLRLDKSEEPANARAIQFAVIIPAHNEETHIAETIESVQRCLPNRGGTKIVVVADNCDDDTATIAKNLNIDVLERNDSTLSGKSYALQFAFEKLIDSEFEYFIVLDADTTCEPNLLVELEKNCADDIPALQVCNLILRKDENPYSMITGIGFCAMNYLRPLARAQIGLSVGLFGNGFALSRKLLIEQPFYSTSITEDYDYHLQLVKNNHRSKMVVSTAVHSELPNFDTGASNQRARWEGGKLSLLKTQLPELLKLIANGQLRLIEPLLELMLPPLSFFLLGLCLLAVLSLTAGDNIGLSIGLIGICIMFTHTLLAIYCLEKSWASLKYVLLIPKFVIWKAAQTVNIAQHSKNTANWIRTRRK